MRVSGLGGPGSKGTVAATEEAIAPRSSRQSRKWGAAVPPSATLPPLPGSLSVSVPDGIVLASALDR